MTTKLVIQGTPYELEDAIGEAAIGDLYTLKVKLGISVKTINQTFKLIGEEAKRDDFEAVDLLDNPDLLLNLQGLIWLAKRKAGEKVTLDAAGQIPFSALSFETDDDELDEVVPTVDDGNDPKALVSAEAADGGVVAET